MLYTIKEDGFHDEYKSCDRKDSTLSDTFERVIKKNQLFTFEF